MQISNVTTPRAPAPIGPYSQAVRCGDLLFISGQIPLDPASGAVDGSTIEEQARRAVGNVLAIAASQGLGADAIVKTTVFLRDMESFPAFNRVYEEAFGNARPARSVVAVCGLPKDVLVEIEAVACS
jgi:2-iminobutanoate/2-iminopropanoate deaminase